MCEKNCAHQIKVKEDSRRQVLTLAKVSRSPHHTAKGRRRRDAERCQWLQEAACRQTAALLRARRKRQDEGRKVERTKKRKERRKKRRGQREKSKFAQLMHEWVRDAINLV
jgi:hypothetical protein